MTRNFRLGAPILAALVHGASSCAYYSQRDGERLHAEVYSLQTNLATLRQALEEVQKEQKAKGEELLAVSREVGELSKAARRNDADLGIQLDEVMQEVGRLKGGYEAIGERLSALETSSSKVQEELDLRFQGLDEKARIDRAKSEEEKQRALDEARARERLLQDPTAVFAEAERLISGGKASEARKLLRELMLRASGEKGFASRHGAQAQYLLGETFFGEGNFQQAAAEYNAVRKNYPNSPWVANALYKLGVCFERLNLPKDAKLFYQTVVEKYPKSQVAKDAKARLKELK